MRTSLRWLSLFMAPALVISLSALMVACGGDDEVADEDVTLVSTSPEAGATVNENSPVTLTFSGDPGTVTVNGGAAEGAGSTRTFNVTQASNDIQWDTGSSTLTFGKVDPPDEIAPTLTGVDPDVQGATDVEPGDLSDGLALTFDEDIDDTDELAISTGGSALNWVPTIDGDTVTLQFNADDPIVNETEYDVEGTVLDAAGNETDISFSFTTKAKE